MARPRRYVVARKRYYKKKRYSSAIALPVASRAVARLSYRRKYRKVKRTRGPLPGAMGVSKKALRALCAQNEDYVMAVCDSTIYNPSVTNVQSAVVGDQQIAHIADNTYTTQRIPNGTGTGAYNNSVVYKQGSHEVTFTNFDSQVQCYKIWILRCARDCPYNTGNQAFYRPSACWETGVENGSWGGIGPTPGPQQGYNNPASDPSDSVMFNRYWSVMKRSSFQLLPGGMKMIKYSLGNLPYKLSVGVDANQLQCIKGVTMAIMYQVYGAPIYNMASQIPYFSPPFFGVVENKRIKFTYAADANKNLGYNTNYIATPVSQQQYMNPLSGAQNNLGTLVTGTGQSGAVPVIGTMSGHNNAGQTVYGILTVQGTGSTMKVEQIPVDSTPS